MATSCAYILITVFTLCLFFHCFEQKPSGSFIQIYDRNGDGKVDIDSEVKSTFDNITILLLESAGKEDGNISSTNGSIGTAPSGQLKLSDFIRFLDVAEVQSPVEALANASDADANGLLNLEEQENFALNFASKILDTDHDGVVSEAESAAYDANQTALQFKKYDADKDGRLSKKELEGMISEFIVPLRAMVANILPKKEDLPLETAKQRMADLGVKSSQIDAADLNGDGKLSFLSEFMDQIGLPLEMAKEMFANETTSGLGNLIDAGMVAEADADGNQFLNYNELLHLLTVDAAMKLGDVDRDGFLMQKEFNDGFTKLQAIYLQKDT